MSGIYGIYRYDGAPVDPQWLERMRSAMSYYGSEGGSSHIEEPLGMGHLLHTLNPEDSFEVQPMRGARGLVVCAARLDNRHELLDTFRIPASEASTTPDGRLVNLAFDRWGEQVCLHLTGDWSLAAWDAKQRRLFLARDILGSGGLYYHKGNGFVAFASSMKALLALPGIIKEPNMLHLAEVLVSWHFDAEMTAYKGLEAVLAAHVITVAADGQIRDRRFWAPEGREPLRYRRGEEYAEAFLEHYTRAVRSCLRSQKSVAAELSGGRDSGSVVALAAPILAKQGRELTAYTSVPYLRPDGAGDGRLGNEWDRAHTTATMAGANVRHIPIDARDYSVIGGVEHFLDLHDGPSHAATNFYWSQAIMEAASQNGKEVLLVGEFGNASVSWMGNGSALLALLQGYPATAFRLFFQGESNPWLLLKRQILKPLLTPGRRLIRRLKTGRRAWQSYSALNVQMAEHLDLDGRMRAAGYDPTLTISPLEDHRCSFFVPEFGASSCLLSEANAWHSFSRLDPTADFSLLEFLLRVPDDQFYRKGQSSLLIKRAMRGRMPETVLHSTQRGLQSADVGHRIVRERVQFEECLRSLESLPEAQAILDLPLLHRCLADLVAKVDPETTVKAVTTLGRGIGVGLFLLRFADSRGDNDSGVAVAPSRQSHMGAAVRQLSI